MISSARGLTSRSWVSYDPDPGHTTRCPVRVEFRGCPTEGLLREPEGALQAEQARRWQTHGTSKLRLGRATWQGHPFNWSFVAYVAGHQDTVARP